MMLKVKLDEGAFLPERAHETDAGADIRTPCKVLVPAHGSAVVHTGVHIELAHGTVGMLKSKSGLNIKSNLICEGVIDEGFTGEIVAKLYNLGGTPHVFNRGDKITQLVVMPVTYPEIVQTHNIVGGKRGDAGYGSTGK